MYEDNLQHSLSSKEPVVLSRKTKELCYTMIRHPVKYSCSVWDPLPRPTPNKLESAQRSAARYVLTDYQTTSRVPSMIQQLGVETTTTSSSVSVQEFTLFTGHSILSINIDCCSLRSEQRHLEFSCGTHDNLVL